MSDIGNQVLKFYDRTPFNYLSDPRIIASKIKSRNIIQDYAPLVESKISKKDVIEFGCGAGWLSLCLSYYYKCKVTSLDFNPRAIRMAETVQEILGTNVKFVCADFTKEFVKETYDWIVSVGVLHHTANAMENLDILIKKYMRQPGNILIGLYHLYGRRPFLEKIKKVKQSSQDVEIWKKEYRKLDSRFSAQEEQHFESWFTDQVLHPFETQHTLKEVLHVFERNGVYFTGTSLNGYRPEETGTILESETEQELKAQNRIQKGVYDPGFFVVTGTK